MASITQWWLSTTDNPYDPFKEWEKWYQFDEYEKKYHTTGLIARFCSCPFDSPEPLLQDSNRRAIGIILKDIPMVVEGVNWKPVTNVIQIDD